MSLSVARKQHGSVGGADAGYSRGLFNTISGQLQRGQKHNVALDVNAQERYGVLQPVDSTTNAHDYTRAAQGLIKFHCMPIDSSQASPFRAAARKHAKVPDTFRDMTQSQNNWPDAAPASTLLTL